MINQTFWKSFVTLCVVVAGVFYIEDRLEKTIEKNIKNCVQQIDQHEIRLSAIERKSNAFSFEYKVATNETNKLIDFINKRFKTSFIKPNEINIHDDK